MGANVSSQKTKSVSKTINNILNSVTTDISTTTSNSASSEQKMQVHLIETQCDVINLIQVMSNKLSVLTNLSDEQSNELATQVKNAVKKDIQQAAQLENSGLNLGQANSSKMETDIETYLENEVKNVVKTSINKSIITTSSGKQEIEFKAKKSQCKNLNISQEMVMEQISQNIASTLVENSLKTVAENEDIQKLKQTAKLKNAGIAGCGSIFMIVILVAAFFGLNMMPMPLQMKLAIGGILLLVFMSICVYMSIKMKKK